MMQTLIGTPWEPDYRGKILCLEDVGERPYRILRMLTHLKLAGRFESLSGVILGSFAGCDHNTGPSLEEVFKSFFGSFSVPVLRGAPFGHQDLNLPFPIGLTASIVDGKVSII